LDEARTDGEQSETPADFRVSFESQPPRNSEGRLPYYVHQLQRCEYYSGFLDEANMSIDEMRALYEELTNYFGVCDYETFPLPCTGLPGYLNKHYDRDSEVAKLLLLGIEYVGAAIRNERKTMHNRWREARNLIGEIEGRGREFVYRQEAEEHTGADEVRDEKPQLVYFIASESGPIKIGIATNPKSRLSGLQTGHHERLELLAICDGGMDQERAYHKQFTDRRLHGEWFERCPEIEAEIERLNRHG
jgi:hypothetical protein